MYPIDPTLLGQYAGMSGTYIPEIWSKKLLEKFYLATVFAAISNTDYEGEIKAHGDKVIIRTTPDIEIKTYKIGKPLVYDRPEGAVVELLIDKGKYFGFTINAVERKQADINYVNSWSDDAGQQMKIAIDAEILAAVPADADGDNLGASAGLISDNINLGAVGTAGESAVVLNKDNIIDKIVECGQVLDEQNIPETSRWIVLPAWAITRIKTSEIKDASLTGDGQSTLRNGRVGRLDRFEIFSSNQVSTSTETTTVCWNAIFGHKSALTFASQLVENEMLKNPSDFGDLIRGLQVYGYKVIKPESMGRLYCRPAALA